MRSRMGFGIAIRKWKISGLYLLLEVTGGHCLFPSRMDLSCAVLVLDNEPFRCKRDDIEFQANLGGSLGGGAGHFSP